MLSHLCLLHTLIQLVRLLHTLLADAVRFLRLCLSSPAKLAAAISHSTA